MSSPGFPSSTVCERGLADSPTLRGKAVRNGLATICAIYPALINGLIGALVACVGAEANGVALVVEARVQGCHREDE